MRERRSGRARLPENPYRWRCFSPLANPHFLGYSFFNGSGSIALVRIDLGQIL